MVERSNAKTEAEPGAYEPIETNAPTVEARIRALGTYSGILRLAIDDVRRAIVQGFGHLHALDGLLGILTPEIREALRPSLKRILQKHRNHIRKIKSGLEGERYQVALHSENRRYVSECLREIIRVLDDYGLLRDMRKEEVGRL